MPPTPLPPPPSEPEWPIPTLNLRVEDLAHPGAVLFFKHIPNPVEALKGAITNVFKLLYASVDKAPTNVESILLVLRPMEGVAYTTDGTECTKEIHFSLQHVVNSQKRCKDEIMGVLTHELVHCFQYNAKDTCPSGLIEGIAGYEKTGYFLDWVDHHYKAVEEASDSNEIHAEKDSNNKEKPKHPGHIVRRLNYAMKDCEYSPSIWNDVVGHTVGILWTAYCASFPPLPKPPKYEGWPVPFLNLQVDDLAHPGAVLFFENVESPLEALREAVLNVFKWLYKDKEKTPDHVASIQLILRSFPEGGVAYTTGSYAEKEIHFALEHIQRADKQGRCGDEIMGVLTHEVVHCFQYDAGGTCPGGLVEGVADWVRLHSNLVPPHWKRIPGAKWDAGYEKTGYFLEWIDRRYGKTKGKEEKGAIVRVLNETMKECEYEEEKIWVDLVGLPVTALWECYCDEMKEKEEIEKVLETNESSGTVLKQAEKANKRDRAQSVDLESDASLDAVVVFGTSEEAQPPVVK
ncbi:pbsp domain protein [Moniliophthora roreri]|uniref:Plant basic secretory protein n=1 Tax=Moniliophthora roreri TaxID=221103 RepID=A0A0W0FMC2_MONRR|nr:pbsp domain protein [Moniliophthora roreri]